MGCHPPWGDILLHGVPSTTRRAEHNPTRGCHRAPSCDTGRQQGGDTQSSGVPGATQPKHHRCHTVGATGKHRIGVKSGNRSPHDSQRMEGVRRAPRNPSRFTATLPKKKGDSFSHEVPRGCCHRRRGVSLGAQPPSRLLHGTGDDEEDFTEALGEEIPQENPVGRGRGGGGEGGIREGLRVVPSMSPPRSLAAT